MEALFRCLSKKGDEKSVNEYGIINLGDKSSLAPDQRCAILIGRCSLRKDCASREGSWQMAKFLVTGGGGFIGSNIVRELLEAGHFVRIIDNFSTGRRENISDLSGSLEIIEGDITRLDEVRRAVEGMEYVLHQAALPSVPRSVRDPLACNEVNVRGTLNTLIASRDEGVKKVVYASSSSVYGDTPVLPKREDMPPNPLSPYALTKLTGEYYCRIFSSIYGLKTICLRYFNVFGPNQDPASQYAAVIPRFITALLRGESPIIYGDGEQSRDFTYVDNIVFANLLAAFSPEGSGKAFNIGCGRRVTLNEMLTLLAAIQNVSIAPVWQEARPGDIRHSLADIALAASVLSYEPKVSLEEGLRLTLEWYRERLRWRYLE